MRGPIRLLFGTFLIFLLNVTLLAQGRPYEGPDDPAGDIAAQREGFMNGNRVFIKFQNNTELADYPPFNTSKWPNDEKGLSMTDGIALLINARVYIENDSIPVTDPDEIASRSDLDTLYFCQSSFRHFMPTNEEGTVEWGLYPVFGYFNEANEYPAMSNLPISWPQNGWPERGYGLKWPGEWDGRFGRGIHYADLETYFVANDAQDQGYLSADDSVKYYPRPGIRIGDRNASVTIQKGMPWGGLGIRIKVRGYQWNNAQTRDALFWEYDISNISDYDLPEVAFGYWLDPGVGHWGDAHDEDDIGFFDRYENLAYVWDTDGIGAGGIRTGVLGFTFLETPGHPDDNIDNDEDGLVDERRDNEAVTLIGPTDGIEDLEKFLTWYGLKESDLKEHWDADEDQDWDDGVDLNDNGIYDPGEIAGDDVGTDGVGPGELNYFGPDENGTEGNHKPDFVEGLGSEPDFGPTDVSETDMIGLTSFDMFPHPRGSSPPQIRFDETMWDLIGREHFTEFFGEIVSLVQTAGSGAFPLLQGTTERISMSEVHSYEELSGLSSDAHSAPALFQKKHIVQVIYESDYRFASPPRMPTLKATAGDGRVFLSWDNAADKSTREPLLNGVNDFEGYKLYKATDKRFGDAEMVTDIFGNPAAKKPIFQCDLDNGINGATEFGLINGLSFYLGDDTGIQHHFIDENVQNGRTYYYAIVAYDFGITGLQVDIAPSENNIVVDLDEDENIRFTGANVQVVTPHQQAAGYVPPNVEIHSGNETMGDGVVSAEVYDINSVIPDNQYKLKFKVDTLSYLTYPSRNRHPRELSYTNNGYEVYNVTRGGTLLYEESPDYYMMDNIVDGHLNTQKTVVSDAIEGIRLHIDMPFVTASFDPEKSGWVRGNAPVNVHINEITTPYYAWQYDIVFTDNDSAYISKINSKTNIRTAENEGIGPAELLLDQAFNFYAINKTFPDSNGVYDTLDMVIHDVNRNDFFDPDSDYVMIGCAIDFGSQVRWAQTLFSLDFHDIGSEGQMPQPDDVYRIDFRRPFWETDSLIFSVNEAIEADAAELEQSMADIKVVPNPYVATNAMEESISNPYLNQRRKLIFTHIPAQCTIKIFMVSGVFIDEIIVDNPPPQGLVHWDLQTREDLEIAAGVYLYHVKSHATGDEKLGKFAVIK